MSLQNVNKIINLEEEDDFSYPNHYKENLKDQFLAYLTNSVTLSENYLNNIINEKFNNNINISSNKKINDIVWDNSQKKQQPINENLSNINKIEENNLLVKENSQTQSSSSHIPEPKLQIFENIFNPRKYFRVEDAKKHFKKAVNDYALSELNRLIKISHLPKRLKRKIHTPSYKTFTSNVKEKDNYDFLNYEFKDILSIGKSTNKLQNFNSSIIAQILKNKNIPDIVKFLHLTYENIIKRFYDSDHFETFKTKKLTQYFCKGIKEEKNISLLEKNGLIKLFKSYEFTKKKRKGIFSVSQTKV